MGNLHEGFGQLVQNRGNYEKQVIMVIYEYFSGTVEMTCEYIDDEK